MKAKGAKVMLETRKVVNTNPWRRKFAYLPLWLDLECEREKEAVYGEVLTPTMGGCSINLLRVWWEAYEWRYTGCYSTLFNEVEYRLSDGRLFRQMRRNSYDC